MARRSTVVLMGPTNLGGDGTQTGNGSSFDWQGGAGMLMVDATWNAATLNLQMQNLNGVWVNMHHDGTSSDIAMTANGAAVFKACAGKMRVIAGAATGVVAHVTGIPSNI